MRLNMLRLPISAAICALTVGLAAPKPAEAQVEPFIGQMMVVGFNFCPRGWSTAEGQILPIAQYTALFSLLGTTYGGDGRTTFGLPDMRGRSNVGVGTGAGLPSVTWGERTGTTSFNITTAQMPAHRHSLNAVEDDATTNEPGSAALAGAGTNIYISNPNPVDAMAAGSIGLTGGGQAISKRSPMLGQYWCIALTGVFPSRN